MLNPSDTPSQMHIRLECEEVSIQIAIITPLAFITLNLNHGMLETHHCPFQQLMFTLLALNPAQPVWSREIIQALIVEDSLITQWGHYVSSGHCRSTQYDWRRALELSTKMQLAAPSQTRLCLCLIIWGSGGVIFVQHWHLKQNILHL